MVKAQERSEKHKFSEILEHSFEFLDLSRIFLSVKWQIRLITAHRGGGSERFFLNRTTEESDNFFQHKHNKTPDIHLVFHLKSKKVTAAIATELLNKNLNIFSFPFRFYGLIFLSAHNILSASGHLVSGLITKTKNF